MIKGDLYCKACFLKVFKEKGSYASFGVKTLPNWKPGQTEEGGASPPPASPPEQATDAKAGSSPPADGAKAGTASPPATTTTVAAPAAAAAAAPPGVNLSSSDLHNPKCKVCLKTVYDQEKQVYDKTVWHIACFKCLSCKRRIDVKAVAMITGDLYCKPCFMKVFKEKGSYASFGPKTMPKWEGDKSALANSGPAAAPAAAAETTPPSASPEPTTPSEPPAAAAAAPAEAAPAATAESSTPPADAPAATT